MLESLRNFSKSWVMRGVLLALAATFVLFFGTDFGGGGGHSGGSSGAASVVEVGDTSFTVHQVSREFNDQIQRASQFTGRQLDPQTAIQAGLLDQAVAQLVTRTLFDQAAQQLGVTTSLDAAATAIRALPQFQGPSGRFERGQFERFLLHNIQTEEQFVNQVRLDLLRTQYIDTIRNAVAAPAPLTDAIFKRRGERRVAELVIVPPRPDAQVGDPDEAQLISFYEDNREAFEAPEFRIASIASMDVETLAQEIVIPEEDLREEYALRGNEFFQPEVRDVAQATFLSREDAQRAKTLIDDGKTFEQAAEEVSGQPPVDLGSVRPSDVPVAELADAAFGLAPNVISGPVESDLGWHLVRAQNIKPGRTIPFEEAREALHAELALEEARDAIFDVLNDVEDGLAGGASLEEVARDSNLTRTRIDGVARNGYLRTEQADPDGAVTAELVQRLFTIDAAGTAETIESRDGGFSVVRLDEIVAPRIPSIDDVREVAITAWKADRVAALAEETAQKIAERARGGESLETLAGEFNARFERTPAFDRTGDGSTISTELIAAVFEASPGEVVAQALSNGAAVAKLIDIEPADMTDPARDDMSAALTGQIANDLVTQLSIALQNDIGVEINREALEDAFLPQR
ncbi:MAG: SurA N-terminal domain-containing protein [Proteobacteria bacterium]|nr:SurA N-terminal domain-containing protein [Pseudomonadota bacterium]